MKRSVITVRGEALSKLSFSNIGAMPHIDATSKANPAVFMIILQIFDLQVQELPKI
jgi:hypothetical protein